MKPTEEPDIYDAVAEFRAKADLENTVKPTTPIDTEMVFLRDVEQRLAAIHNAAVHNRVNLPGILGLSSVVQCRIAEVTKLRDKENAGASSMSELQRT